MQEPDWDDVMLRNSKTGASLGESRIMAERSR